MGCSDVVHGGATGGSKDLRCSVHRSVTTFFLMRPGRYVGAFTYLFLIWIARSANRARLGGGKFWVKIVLGEVRERIF